MRRPLSNVRSSYALFAVTLAWSCGDTRGNGSDAASGAAGSSSAAGASVTAAGTAGTAQAGNASSGTPASSGSGHAAGSESLASQAGQAGDAGARQGSEAGAGGAGVGDASAGAAGACTQQHCEVQEGHPFCGDMQVTWVCHNLADFDYQLFRAACDDAATNAVRYCCPPSFHGECP